MNMIARIEFPSCVSHAVPPVTGNPQRGLLLSHMLIVSLSAFEILLKKFQMTARGKSTHSR
jgi:hypothetical protein